MGIYSNIPKLPPYHLAQTMGSGSPERLQEVLKHDNVDDCTPCRVTGCPFVCSHSILAHISIQELLHSWGWAPTATSLDTPNSKHKHVRYEKSPGWHHWNCSGTRWHGFLATGQLVALPSESHEFDLVGRKCRRRVAGGRDYSLKNV